VTAVRTGKPAVLAESNGFPWDDALWRMVCSSNGGAVQAALTVFRGGSISGSLSSGLHHAKAGRGDGFCTFNGLVLAARRVLDEGAQRVLIIDLDAHCGGGTHQLLGQDARVSCIDVAVDAYDRYVGHDRWTLDLVDRAVDYLPTLRRRLDGLAGDSFDVALYNAGMDPYERCEIGGLDGITADLLAEREAAVFRWCSDLRVPVAFVLAGGYVSPGFDEADLVNLHRLTIEAAARAGSDDTDAEN
jgi:acetoin utilization deacetylase AcuC-like enzyme